eukprot:scaffold1217_cov62-Phaeocystis_antarctica.AAC.2
MPLVEHRRAREVLLVAEHHSADGYSHDHVANCTEARVVPPGVLACVGKVIALPVDGAAVALLSVAHGARLRDVEAEAPLQHDAEERCRREARRASRLRPPATPPQSAWPRGGVCGFAAAA